MGRVISQPALIFFGVKCPNNVGQSLLINQKERLYIMKEIKNKKVEIRLTAEEKEKLR